MEQAARAAGIADNNPDPELSPTRDVEVGRPYRSRTRSASRASLPTSHRRSFSTHGGGRKSRAESARSRPESTTLPIQRNDAEPVIASTAAAPAGTAAGDIARHDTSTIALSTTAGGATADEDDADDDGDDDDDTAQRSDGADIPWGPDHPCFPHPNPHVPLSSPLHASTRVIRVKRDWMVAGDLAPTFTTLYPEILDWFPSLPESAFKELIRQLNTALEAAFSPWDRRGWLDVLLGLATGWLWDDAGLTKAKRAIAKAEQILERWNAEHGAADGVSFIPLRRTGYLSLDIQIPDPQIVDANDELDGVTRGDGDDDDDEGDEQGGAETGVSGSLHGRASTDGANTSAAGGGRSGSMLARPGSRGSTQSGVSPSSAAAAAAAARVGQPQPMVPTIPADVVQENVALAITMEGFRNSSQ